MVNRHIDQPETGSRLAWFCILQAIWCSRDFCKAARRQCIAIPLFTILGGAKLQLRGFLDRRQYVQQSRLSLKLIRRSRRYSRLHTAGLPEDTIVSAAENLIYEVQQHRQPTGRCEQWHQVRPVPVPYMHNMLHRLNKVAGKWCSRRFLGAHRNYRECAAC